MLHTVDLNRLRVFQAVFRHRGITGAAAALRLTASAVSQSIRALEEELGVPLFVRLPRSMLPTRQAEDLHRVVSTLAVNLESCTAGWRAGREEPRGRLAIGAPPELGSRQVLQALTAFGRYPETRFHLELGLPDRLLALLVAGELDLALCDSGPHLKAVQGTVTWRTVFQERAVLVAERRFYAARIAGDHTFKHLRALPHVDYRPDGRVLALWYAHHFGRVPAELPLKLTVGSVRAVIEAALQGLGLAFIPEHLITEPLRRGTLVPIQTGKDEYVNPIELAQLKDHVPSLLEKRFLDELARVLALGKREAPRAAERHRKVGAGPGRAETAKPTTRGGRPRAPR